MRRSVVLCRYVSRDRNIVQFYGACVQTNSLLLVIELMEVSMCIAHTDRSTSSRSSKLTLVVLNSQP
jgi:hypothetical protein